MAFGRKIELSIGQGGTGLLVSGLDVSFKIERGLEQDGNTANFIIHNAKDDTINRVLVEGANVIFKAGYEDEGNVGTIFIGTVTKVINKKNKIDKIIDITATDLGSNKQGLEYAVVNLNYIAKSPLILVLSDLAASLGIPITGIENVTSTLNNGFVHNGSIGAAIKKIRQILYIDNLGLFFDNSEMVIYKKGEISTFGVVRVTPNNGLIGIPSEITDKNSQDDKKRIEFTTLLNPKLKVNGVVNLVSNNINGSFIIEKITFEGDNFGKANFVAKVEASS